METRTKTGREKQKIARAFMTHNMLKKTEAQKQIDFSLGMRVQKGSITDVSDVIRAVSILNELVISERITKKESETLKMNLAKKMSGFKIVRK